MRYGFFFLFAGLAAALASLTIPAHSAQQPNFVLLMGDDHGWDEVGYYGHAHVKTPVLDEMAATGLQMNRFYASSPVCSPTRGSVISGRHPNRYGAFTPNWSIRPEEIGIAQVLRDAGYATGHFGKWHLGPVKAESPTNPGAMGFEEWLSHDNFFELDPWLSRNGGPPEQFMGESSEVIVAEAIRFVEKAKREGRPFFVVVWFGSPHEPYSGLEKDLALYDNLPAHYSEQFFRQTSNETGLPVELPLREILRARYAEITAMDRAIGRMRGYLANEGLRDNTLFWYFSDNGSTPEAAVTLPLRGQKGQVYEGGVRVPSVLEWPARIPGPVVTDVNAVTSDVFPTLAELAGVPLPDRPMDGISLVPLFEGRMTERPAPIFFWHGGPTRPNPEPYIDPELQQGTTPLVTLRDGSPLRSFRNDRYSEIREEDFRRPRAVVDNRYKLVIAGRGGREDLRELFDLRNDPAENMNLIDARPEVAKRLEQQLRQWQQSVLESLTGADYH